MQKFLKNLPLLLLVIFELFLGVMLLVDPVGITRIAIIVFGVLILLIALFQIILFLRTKTGGTRLIIMMALAVLTLLVGLVCVFMSDQIIGFFEVLFLLYGIGILVGSVFKFGMYLDSVASGMRSTVLLLIDAIASAIIGAIICFNWKSDPALMWRVAGVSLIGEGLLGLVTLVAAFLKKEPKSIDIE